MPPWVYEENDYLCVLFTHNTSLMKHILHLGMLAVLACGSLQAQTSLHIQGQLLQSSDRHAVDFANVLLLSPKDSSLISGAVTDSLGYFRLQSPAGSYLLLVRALGHRPYYQSLTLRRDLDLGQLLLQESAEELASVRITGKRPIMLRKADRMVFDASQIAPAAASALDVLRQTPGVNVSDDGIGLIGKGTVIVLINDKRIRLSGKALVSLLRSYPQSSLQEIQILTTPPAKYEAEGNAGVLNLLLKKVPNDYFGGTISLSFGQVRGLLNGGASANLNYKRARTTASLQIGGDSYGYRGEFGTYRTYPAQRLYSSSVSEFKTRSHQLGLRASLDQELTPELTLGFNLNYTPSKEKPRRSNDTRNYLIAPDGSLQLQRSIPGLADEEDRENYSSANIHLEKTFRDKPHRRLSWDADYVGYRSTGTRDFSASAFDPVGSPIAGSDFRFHSIAQQRTHSYLTNIDYTTPLGASTLSLGAKATWSRTRNANDYDAQSSIGEHHDRIRFDEHIYALYADLQQPLNGQWNLRTGLRLEYTHTAGEHDGRQLEHLRSYLNLFPSLFLSYTPSDRHAFSFDGSVRINRPHFSQLSPFPRYENQYSVLLGKEDLGPAKTAKLALGYTFLGKLNFQAYSHYTWDGITQVVRLDPQTNQARYSTDNAERSFATGLENSYVLTSIPFLQCYLSQRLEYIDSRARDRGIDLYRTSTFSYQASLSNTFFFNRSKTFQGTLFASYQSPSAEGGARTEHSLSTGAGLSYSLLKQKLRLSADLYNLFGKGQGGSITTPDYQMRIASTLQRYILSFQLSYSFGAPLQDKQASKNAQELRSRM